MATYALTTGASSRAPAIQSKNATVPPHRPECTPAYNSLNVLLAALRFCEATGTAHATFGRRAANDPRLIDDMLNGRVLRPETELRIRAFIDNRATASPRKRRKPTDPTRLQSLPPIGDTANDAAHRRAMIGGSRNLLAAIQRERGEA